jgi:hypothetical protein
MIISAGKPFTDKKPELDLTIKLKCRTIFATKQRINETNKLRQLHQCDWDNATVTSYIQADGNGLAHLGLLARSAETGELPRSSPARRLNPADRRQASGEGGAREQAPEVRVPIWGICGGGAHRGGLTAAMQVGRGEPTMAGGRRGGERWLGVHGAVVSSGGGCCGDRGACRWPEVALDGRVASATKGGGRLVASTVACGGWWFSGRLGVAQRRMRAVWGGRRFSAWSRGVR